MSRLHCQMTRWSFQEDSMMALRFTTPPWQCRMKNSRQTHLDLLPDPLSSAWSFWERIKTEHSTMRPPPFRHSMNMTKSLKISATNLFLLEKNIYFWAEHFTFTWSFYGKRQFLNSYIFWTLKLNFWSNEISEHTNTNVNTNMCKTQLQSTIPGTSIFW